VTAFRLPTWGQTSPDLHFLRIPRFRARGVASVSGSSSLRHIGTAVASQVAAKHGLRESIVAHAIADGRECNAPGVMVVDVRHLFRNPYRDRALRHQNGTDAAVQADIQNTPEFQAKYDYVKQQITAPGTEIAFVGCTGGTHRSVYVAERLGRELGVPVEHRDLNRAKS
jgi:RNase adaptor protein for sRNA GlmZ degradation